MPKNIVICCDGTRNDLKINKISNVIHLHSCLQKSDRQIAYYSPGVGTLAPTGIKSRVFQAAYMLRDALSATTLEEDVKNAYIYLMNTYEKGDKIFLFGFSRGAYTVRMLHGIIQRFGLLDKGNENHYDHIVQSYSKKRVGKFHLANRFKKRFSQNASIHFIGIWDTVVSIGNPFSFYKAYPNSSTLEEATTVRHCLAIDEFRKHYLPQRIQPVAGKDHIEVFFAGAHSDIGGSYKDEESGLSKIALKYMLGEASDKGLLLNKERVETYLGIKGKSKYKSPDVMQKPHNPKLNPLFLFADVFPRIRYNSDSLFKISVDLAWWRRRKIGDKAFIHSTVKEKLDKDKKYSPGNLKGNKETTLVTSKTIVYAPTFFNPADKI